MERREHGESNDVEFLDVGPTRRAGNAIRAVRTRRGRWLLLSLTGIVAAVVITFVVQGSDKPSASLPTPPHPPGTTLTTPSTSPSPPARTATAEPIPAALKRPLHFPVLRSGQPCPATPGHPLNTRDFGGMALGQGLVQPLISGSSDDVARGTADLLTHTSEPPWLAFKTLWVAVPAYRGPFLVRAKRLDGPGSIGVGGTPEETSLAVPAAPAGSRPDYRAVPCCTWVRQPGCYAWQVDGLTFSEIIVVRAVVR